MRQYYVYTMTNKKNGTLYIGVSSNLVRRVYQHKQGKIAGFTKKYGSRKLVYFEVLDDIQAAISREKQRESGSVLGNYPSLINKTQTGKICIFRFCKRAWIPGQARDDRGLRNVS